MIRARLNVDGLKEALDRVDELGDRARAPEPALWAPATMLDLQLGERRKFKRGGWKPATREWVWRKRQEGKDPRTLRYTGRLEAAMVNATDGVGRVVHKGGLTWGLRGRTDIYYARMLAKGVRGQPPRRMVVIDRIGRKSIAHRVEHFIATGQMTGASRA